VAALRTELTDPYSVWIFAWVILRLIAPGVISETGKGQTPKKEKKKPARRWLAIDEIERRGASLIRTLADEHDRSAHPAQLRSCTGDPWIQQFSRIDVRLPSEQTDM
jgi:hypothetical protein